MKKLVIALKFGQYGKLEIKGQVVLKWMTTLGILASDSHSFDVTFCGFEEVLE